MKLLVAVNILLDVLQAREPFVKDSSLIWKVCEQISWLNESGINPPVERLKLPDAGWR